MPHLSRRTLLTAATLALTPGSATATAAAGRKPRAAPPRPRDTQGQQGNASITVFLSQAQDVTAIHYTITDIGSTPDTFTIWYTDLRNGRQSRKLTYPLDPGESASAEVYGSVNHTFLVNVCQSDGTCFAVGPVGPVPSIGNAPARGLNLSPRRAATPR